MHPEGVSVQFSDRPGGCSSVHGIPNGNVWVVPRLVVYSLADSPLWGPPAGHYGHVQNTADFFSRDVLQFGAQLRGNGMVFRDLQLPPEFSKSVLLFLEKLQQQRHGKVFFWPSVLATRVTGPTHRARRLTVVAVDPFL